MSAWIVSENHIRSLVNYAKNRHISVAWKGLIYEFGDPEDADEMANELIRQNYASVNYRYSESTPVPAYEHGESRPDHITDVQVFKSCNCYAYQSCETQDWEDTFAYKINSVIAEAATHRLITDTKEYSNAKWGID